MRNILIILTLLKGLYSEAQEDYKIRINDSSLAVSPDKEYQIVVNGQKINLMLMLNDTLRFDNSQCSFQHLKEYKVAKTELGKGIEQAVLLTAEGSGILIQSYLTINPTNLNETMLKEITKESLSYGYEMKREDYERTLKSGQQVKVDRAVLTYRGQRNIYEVMTIGKKDQGVLIVSLVINEEKSAQALGIIDLLWRSFVYK
jgi:hypothetical protein